MAIGCVRKRVAGTQGDTQSIEGMNSIIKYICALAPSISWELLSSRITIKKKVRSLSLHEPSNKDHRFDFVASHADVHKSAVSWLREASDRFEVNPTDPENR